MPRGFGSGVEIRELGNRGFKENIFGEKMFNLKTTIEGFSFGRVPYDKLGKTIDSAADWEMTSHLGFGLNINGSFTGLPLYVMVLFGDTYLFDKIWKKMGDHVKIVSFHRMMHIAIWYNRTLMITHLLDMGANPNEQSLSGVSPFHLYCRKMHPFEHDLDCLYKFIAHGANPDLADNSGETPLDLVQRIDKIETVRFLLRQKLAFFS